MQNILVPSTSVNNKTNNKITNKTNTITNKTNTITNKTNPIKKQLNEIETNKRRIETEKINITGIFDQLSIYPSPTKPLMYPPSYRYVSNKPQFTINDMIYINTDALVPNIDIGYYEKKLTPTELEEWITTTKEYYESLNQHFQKKCDAQQIKLQRIEEQKQRCKKFDMKMMDKLPEDMLNEIRKFMLPETRMAEYTAIYPLYIETLSKMTTKNLHLFYKRAIYEKYYNTLLHYTNREQLLCLSTQLNVGATFKNKAHCINQIKQIFDAYINAIPRTPETHEYFQKQALKMLKTIIYFGYHMGNKFKKNR